MSWFDSIQGAVDAASSMDILNLDQMAVEQEHEQQAGGVDQSALEEAMYAEIERVNATLERERAKLLPESEQQQQQASDQLADLPTRIPPRSAESTGSAGTAGTGSGGGGTGTGTAGIGSGGSTQPKGTN